MYRYPDKGTDRHTDRYKRVDNRYKETLVDHGLSNYNKLVRPVVNVSEAVTVRLKLKLSQLIDVVR
jgi:hypothetical protein